MEGRPVTISSATIILAPRSGRMNLRSHAIKAAVAAYLRYNQQHSMVAFECRLGGEIADVLSITGAAYNHLIMVEVKTSLGDFKRDGQKPYHHHFRNDTGILPVLYFYFAVPKELANKVAYLYDDLYPYAGVLGCNGFTGVNIDIHRRPKKLSCMPLKEEMVKEMTRAQTATLCRLAMKVAEQDSDLIRMKAQLKEYRDGERLER